MRDTVLIRRERNESAGKCVNGYPGVGDGASGVVANAEANVVGLEGWIDVIGAVQVKHAAGSGGDRGERAYR